MVDCLPLTISGVSFRTSYSSSVSHSDGLSNKLDVGYSHYALPSSTNLSLLSDLPLPPSLLDKRIDGSQFSRCMLTRAYPSEAPLVSVVTPPTVTVAPPSIATPTATTTGEDAP